MLKTATQSTFEYRGHFAIARKMVDNLTGKFFCWQGRFDGIKPDNITADGVI